mgnify:CR=1 FL=1|tara:strand:- start:296 stop:505 length:210 start_codon:yes stop_codon:yes gene_type:complete
MKIEALSSFGLKGEVVQVGEVVEASPSETRQLINSGQAKEAVVCEVQKEEPKAKPKAKKAKTSTPEVTD